MITDAPILDSRLSNEAPTRMKPRPLEMIPVDSSNILAIGYSSGPSGKPGNLYVDFKAPRNRPSPRYCYGDVPAETWENLLAATSKGAFLEKVIKGTYEFYKVEK